MQIENHQMLSLFKHGIFWPSKQEKTQFFNIIAFLDFTVFEDLVAADGLPLKM